MKPQHYADAHALPTNYLKESVSKIVDVLFGCRHRKYSFPITLKPCGLLKAERPSSTYVVCLDCGKKLPYDWTEMRLTVHPPNDSIIAKAASSTESGWTPETGRAVHVSLSSA